MLIAQVVTLAISGYSIKLNPANDRTISVAKGANVVWRGVTKKWKPWKLAAGDIDGNGRPDFGVGIFKSTHLYPHPHNTVFFYEIRDGEVVPKWKGSSLGRPLVDFAYVSTKEGPRLAAIQTLLDGKQALFTWRWHRFGFRLLKQKGEWRKARILKSLEGEIELSCDGAQIRVKI